MTKIATFVKGLIRRAREMKDLRIALVMTLIPVAFILALEGVHSTQLTDKIFFSLAGLILFMYIMWFWNRIIKGVKRDELQERESRDNSTKAVTDLVNQIADLVDEIRKDRAERSNKASKE